MVDPKLLSYVKKELARGASKDKLRAVLVAKKWPEKEVDAALKEAQPEEPKKVIKEIIADVEKKKPKIKQQKCPKCGAIYGADDDFCPSCGKRLALTRFEQWWKFKSYWLRGAIIGLSIFALLIVSTALLKISSIFMILVIFISQTPLIIPLLLNLRSFVVTGCGPLGCSPSIYGYIFIMLFWILIGALIGWMIGKRKARKEKIQRKEEVSQSKDTKEIMNIALDETRAKEIMDWKGCLKPSFAKILIAIIFALPYIVGLWCGGTSEFCLVGGVVAVPFILLGLPLHPLIDKLYSTGYGLLARYISIIILLVYYYILICLAVFIFKKISSRIGKKKIIIIFTIFMVTAGSVYGYYSYEENKSQEQKIVEKCVKDECYFDAAQKFRNPSICQKIKKQPSKEQCYSDTVNLTMDSRACEKIPSIYKESCYFWAGKNQCGSIPERAIVENCYKSICGPIKGVQEREYCYQSKSKVIDILTTVCAIDVVFDIKAVCKSGNSYKISIQNDGKEDIVKWVVELYGDVHGGSINSDEGIQAFDSGDIVVTPYKLYDVRKIKVIPLIRVLGEDVACIQNIAVYETFTGNPVLECV